MNIVKVVSPHVNETFAVGNVILIHKEGIDYPAVLSQVDPSRIEAINLIDGNRWTDSIVVKNIDRLTYDEVVLAAAGHSFTKVNAVIITDKGE